MSEAKTSGSKGKDRKLHQVVMEDLRQTRWDRYAREVQDLYFFYVDDERRNELESMGRIRRAFTVLFWILKSLLMKLSAVRRVLLTAAFVCIVIGYKDIRIGDFNPPPVDLRYIAFALVLLVLMLELRDKLLARDEIAVARQVQLALFPSEHPDVPGWSVWSVSRPANDVGGDLVDYLEMDAFRHAVLLGDVAGKGLGAALLTAKLQATIRALVPDVTSLDDLGARVNYIFHRDGLDNRYATLFFVELEHHSGHLRYLNAGHNPAFVIHSNRIESLSASSFPLGMLDSASYEEGALDLGHGDVLLAYSDGLTEATNAEGEEYGVDRLQKLLPELHTMPPKDIGTLILADVDSFLGDTRLNDDLSLAIIVKH